ncbi:MAG: acyl-[acyl-carrier-protein] thioesterase [Ponticaulis sp.]|nr:acyl-[acyl-carrier-protein] thioesterase [Ponticaulis sp.]
MNVRFYVNRQVEGVHILAHAIGLPELFTPNGKSTLIPIDQHIRYIKEVHAGKPLTMVGGVIEIDEDEILLYQELRHTVSGDPAAAFRTRLRHVEAKTLKRFPWNETTLEKLEALKVTDLPTNTAPRSADLSSEPLPDSEISSQIAEDFGAKVIGRCAVPIQQCDPFGRMGQEYFMGRISDSVPNLLNVWREQVTKDASTEESPKRTGGAVLELRMIFRAWPKAGDLMEIRSGLGEVKPKVHSLVHWVLDPSTGKPWVTAQAYAVTFDLNTRKVIAADPRHMDMLEQHAARGLRL